MTDVVARIDSWREGVIDYDYAETLHDARDEIVVLRAMLKNQDEASVKSVELTGSYASRYGFLLGGLEMVAAGHTTADRVLAAVKEKYGE